MSFAINRFLVRTMLILRSGGALLLVLILSYRWLDQQLTEKLQDEVFSNEGMSSMVWVYAALSILTTLVFPILTTLVVIGALKAKSFAGTFQFVFRRLSQVLKEQMRAFGIALLWGIPLIVPTFWKLFQFLFVPLVVCLDPRYDSGNIHAPSRSAELVRRKFWPALLLSGVLFFALPLFIIGFEDSYTWSAEPIQLSLLVIFEFAATILGQLLLIRLWEKAHGTDFQLS